MTSTHPLCGRTAVLATLHDKTTLIAPALATHVGMMVDEIAMDTDALGTFSGEVPRPGTPLETAVTKARLAMSASGSTLALASEGVFGPHPDTPFVTCDTEIVVLVDDAEGYVVHEFETMIGVPALSIDVTADSFDEARLEAGGFPDHGVIVRPTGRYDSIVKGIHDRELLRGAVARCAAASPEGTARVESDFRAIHHPTRRRVIERAAERLARRLAVVCAGCGTPGWGVVDLRRGAPCAHCGMPTALPLAEIHGCVRCDLTEWVRVAADGGVDPGRCARCNP